MYLERRKACQLVVIPLIATSTSLFSATTLNKVVYKDGPPSPSYVITLSAGPAWADPGETQTFYVAPDIIKTYVPNNSTRTLAAGEIFIGLQQVLSEQWQGQFGIAVAAAGNAKLSGIIWDDADPQFDNYSYSYRINHGHIAAKAKLLFDRGYAVIPWISGSAGVGFNHAYDFNNNPLIFEAIQMPNFASNTKTTFTYTLGAGLQKAISTNWQIGVGYEFADWGKSQLDRSVGQTLNSGLALDHVYTNGVMFNITYLA
ncbi:outer membrane protein [Legionella hackeliae]|uniref:Outer membrane protein beta-barrel domain-containing protein n=1 Tax=Legionella hackeliae TaxID=449 RepID=A0A0A8UVC4_LEGHA|nr:porin family protein [Legionella hackeliae]KTD11458.1 hypothetical protein Lhac_1854 [Legionella hackeliae]CEK10709.1 conserved exported protein of unknown function [Legionella hackeliae]STX47458.1 Opacity protein and related surface antigens [Legionella hackeliae]